jgi:hypothetical protein
MRSRAFDTQLEVAACELEPGTVYNFDDFLSVDRYHQKRAINCLTWGHVKAVNDTAAHHTLPPLQNARLDSNQNPMHQGSREWFGI